MGSFNVSCGISQVSIKEGVECRFIPLQPKYLHKPVHVLEPASMIHYPNSIFNPFCFPIKGKYNDYGNIEEIEKDFNTELIEEYFGIPIEEFVQCASCTRGVNDSYGDIFRNYAINQEALKKNFGNDNDTPLQMLGFKKEVREVSKEHRFEGYSHPKLSDGIFIVLNVHLKNSKGYSLRDNSTSDIFKVEEDKNSYAIFNTFDDKVLISTFASTLVKDLLNAIYQLTKVHINYKEEDYNKVNMLRRMSGMFVLEEIYQLVISQHEGMDDWTVKRINESIEADRNAIAEGLKKKEELIAQKEAGAEIDAMDIRFADPLSTFNLDRYYSIDEIRKWNHAFFGETYFKIINTDTFFNAVKDYQMLYSSMNAMSKHFTPNLNGSQSGNYEASKVLAEKTLEIVNRRIKEMEEW